jgi:hypothetical protein
VKWQYFTLKVDDVIVFLKNLRGVSSRIHPDKLILIIIT